MNLLEYAKGQLLQLLATHPNYKNTPKESLSPILDHTLSSLITGMLRKSQNKEDFAELHKRIHHDAIHTDLAPQFVGDIDSEKHKHIQNSGGNITHFLFGDKHDEFVADVAATNQLPSNQAHIFTNISAYTLAAILKQYLLGRSATGVNHPQYLSQLLGRQTEYLPRYVKDSTTQLLGWGSAAALFTLLGDRVKNLFIGFGGAAQDWAADLTGVFQSSHDKASSVVTAKSIHQVHHTAVETKEKESWLKWLWLIPLLLLAAWLLRHCSNRPPEDASLPMASSTDASMLPAVSGPMPASVSTPVSSAATPAVEMQASKLNLQFDKNMQANVTATVASEAEKNQLLDALKAKLGDAFKPEMASITIDANTKPASWLANVGAWLPDVKLANAGVNIVDPKITLEGEAANPKLALVDKIKAAAGSGIDVAAGFFNNEQAAQVANASADQALTALAASCQAKDLVSALNLQRVNFGSGSAVVPKDTRDLLQKHIKTIKACTEKVKLKIDGYTDNQGKAEANVTLSKKRADAIAHLLMQLGFTREGLLVQGMGDANAMADNTTPEGRFKNRRIEFSIAE